MAVDRSRLPSVGPDPAFAFPAIRRHRLPNGLDVRVVERPGVPLVTFGVLVEGGSGADPRGQDGLMALVADMVDEGTSALDAIGVSDTLARIGGDYDVDVGPDSMAFSLTTPVRFSERAASLLADLVARPSLRDADVERVRSLRIDRLRQLKDHAPAVAEREFLRLLYGDHPYGHLSIGDEASLTSITSDLVRQAHAAACRPDASVLVAVGAMPADALIASAERAFGSWTSVEARPLGRIMPPDPPAARARPLITVVPRAGAAQSELRMGHLSAARRDSPDYYALIVLNAVLGGQFVSRINMKLRQERAFTYGARTSFDWHRDGSVFALHTSVHSASTAEAIADSIAELTAIRESRPPSPTELDLAKASLTRGYPRGFETIPQVARGITQLAHFGLPDDYFERFVLRVNAVTEADVARAAAEYLHVEALTTLVVGDPDVVAEPLCGLGEVDVRAGR